MKCFEKISEDRRNDIFQKFYALKTKDEQDIHLQGCLEIRNVQRRVKPKTENEKRNVPRSCSFVHFVSINGKRLKVCQNAFISLHDTGVKRLKRIKNLLKKNETPRDRRGTNPKTHAIKEETNILIRQHIQAFPVKVAHYSAQTYEYLNPRLTLKIMYKMYSTKHPDAPVSYSYYVKYFHEHFTLRFGRPQIDTCCKCEELNVKIKSPSLGDAAKRAAVAELLVHKRRAKKFYSSLQQSTEECKNRDEMVPLSFDFMQNVHLPEVPVQDLFYLTQLTVNVFGIHNLKTGQAFFYIYHEGLGNKGPNEVCSFVMDYINNYIPESVKELRLYSDNCPGQNKNHTMVRMCMALAETGRFDKVEQFFPIRGHSFLPCDRDFGLIKKKITQHDRIFSIHQYTELVVKSSAKNHFTVKEIATDDVLDFKNWWTKYYKKQSLSLETNKRGVPRNQKRSFSISQFHYFLHQSSKPGYLVASEYLNSFIYHTFPLHMPRNYERIPLELPHTKAYPEGNVPILETKIGHLQKMLPYIEEEFQEFYSNIISCWPTKKPSKQAKE